MKLINLMVCLLFESVDENKKIRIILKWVSIKKSRRFIIFGSLEFEPEDIEFGFQGTLQNVISQLFKSKTHRCVLCSPNNVNFWREFIKYDSKNKICKLSIEQFLNNEIESGHSDLLKNEINEITDGLIRYVINQMTENENVFENEIDKQVHIILKVLNSQLILTTKQLKEIKFGTFKPKFELQTISIYSIIEWYGVDLNDFNLKAEYFDANVHNHKVDHLYRVSILTMILGFILNDKKLGIMGMFCGLIHDLGRSARIEERFHGLQSAKTKFSIFVGNMKKYGINDVDMEDMKQAVIKHCCEEASPKDSDYLITNLLKDADGLDRVRFCGLDESYLRYPQSLLLIDYCYDILEKTYFIQDCVPFAHFIKFIENIKVPIQMNEL